MVVEVILQLLICIIDAELLKAVRFKVFKTKNVQNSNGQTLKKKIKYMMRKQDDGKNHETF